MIIIYSVRSSVHLLVPNRVPPMVLSRNNIANQVHPLYTIPILNRVFKDQMINNGPAIIKVIISKVKSAVFIVVLFIFCGVRKFSLDKGWGGTPNSVQLTNYYFKTYSLSQLPIEIE